MKTWSPRVSQLLELARESMTNEDPGHDFSHILRVLENCRWLAQKESAKEDILFAAGIMHDFVNVPKDHADRLFASKKSAEKSKDILYSFEFNESEVQQISLAIEEHSFSLAKKPSSLESAILQDADKLDALGAIGILRTISCGTRMHSSFYEINDPLAERRLYDDRKFMLDHFSTKSFKLPEMMNTEAARLEAVRRRDFMQGFLQVLLSELKFSHQPEIRGV